MKIFYRVVNDPAEMLDKYQTSLEEIFLPAEILEDFHKSLVQSTTMLPPAARKFQEWQVGLLDRYEN